MKVEFGAMEETAIPGFKGRTLFGISVLCMLVAMVGLFVFHDIAISTHFF